MDPRHAMLGHGPRRATLDTVVPLTAALQGGPQLRSRWLGQEEHNLMLALGMVRAATRAIAALEPKLQRAQELLRAPQRTAATSLDLKRVAADAARTVQSTELQGRPLLDGTTAVFNRPDRESGEQLRIELPDLTSVVLGDEGLEAFALGAFDRKKADLLAMAIAAQLQSSKNTLRDAERQLVALLQQFDTQRRNAAAALCEQALDRLASSLRSRVVRAGGAALAAQGGLSNRAALLVLGRDED